MRRASGHVRTAERTLITGVCECCGQRFIGHRGKHRKFCGGACRRRYLRMTRIAEWETLKARLDTLIRKG